MFSSDSREYLTSHTVADNEIMTQAGRSIDKDKCVCLRGRSVMYKVWLGQCVTVLQDSVRKH